jgi:hypothetical protein
MNKFLLTTMTAVCLMLPLGVQAQDVPSYATQQSSADQNIHGRIASFDGDYNLTVNDELGYIDNVRMHPGTIINPTGLMLAPGMVVSILGYNAGSYFSANEIDTPYQFEDGVPYYASHPWDYYGPSISLGFFFGNSGWWHGRYFSGRFNYVGGVRAYGNVRVNEIYRQRGGEFHGRDFVAPAEHGGYYGRASSGHAGGGGEHSHK